MNLNNKQINAIIRKMETKAKEEFDKDLKEKMLKYVFSNKELELIDIHKKYIYTMKVANSLRDKYNAFAEELQLHSDVANENIDSLILKARFPDKFQFDKIRASDDILLSTLGEVEQVDLDKIISSYKDYIIK